jgi:hypothetical protein
MKQKPSYHKGKKSGPPPEKGPQSQGLNIKYNSVKTVKLTEKINGRHRQGSSKRA